MKKVRMLLLSLVCMPMLAFAVKVEERLTFTMQYNNPDRDHKGAHRASAMPIYAIKNDYLLSFDNCNGCVVYVMQEDKVVCIVTINEEGQVEIPSNIIGTVQVRLVKGNVSYQAEVEF